MLFKSICLYQSIYVQIKRLDFLKKNNFITEIMGLYANFRNTLIALIKNMDLRIIPFQSHLAADFKALNMAWLEKFFFVEPKDELLLNNCEESIIRKGGLIFFAELDNKIVGCFSFIKVEDKVYELGKMAVDHHYQGLKIGQTLLNYGIDHAKEHQWNKIVLYSSRKLNTALHIYEKYGFKEIEMENEQPYTRGDIKMELVLSKKNNVIDSKKTKE